MPTRDAPVSALNDPSILSDPYPTYREAFAGSALVRSEGPDFSTWFVGHHAEVSRLLRDPRLSSNRVRYLAHRLSPEHRELAAPLLGGLQPWVLFQDPPDHTPLRRSINAALSRRLISKMQPAIERLVSELLDEVAPRGRLDVVADLAYPLPAIVIAEMLGARAEDRGLLKGWSEDIARFLGTATTPAEALKAQGSVVAMMDYFREVLARHRAAPRDDLLGALLSVQGQTLGFDDESLLSNCVGLVFAGHETTTNLIGNAVHLLLERPALAQALRRDPAGWERAIEEVLRIESPVQRMSRIATVELEVGEARISTGDRLIMVVGAANRDPAVFEAPDTFEPARHPNPHLAFGFGIHLCSGTALARLEAKSALWALFERLDRLEREAPARWTPNFGLRSLETLPVSFRVRSG